VQTAEGAKFWAGVLAELRNRGVADVLIACCDGLTGFPEAIEATWPNTVVQTSSVHMGAGGRVPPAGREYRRCSPSAARASVKHTSIWVEVSSAETRQASHLRETMSSTAAATRRARVKWVILKASRPLLPDSLPLVRCWSPRELNQAEVALAPSSLPATRGRVVFAHTETAHDEDLLDRVGFRWDLGYLQERADRRHDGRHGGSRQSNCLASL
jgi:hypothetical protein